MIRILLHYMKQFAKSRMIYRGDFYADVFSFLLGVCAPYISILILLENSDGSFGDHWEPAQVIFIWGMFMVPHGIFNVLAPNLFSFPEKHINQGHFDRILLRPLPALPQIFMENFRFGALVESLAGVIAITYYGHQFGWHWDIEKFLLFGMFSICGATLILSVFVVISSISFFSQDRLGVGAPVWNTMSFGRWPVAIFPQFIQFVLIWVLPFACVGFLPAAVLMGDMDALSKLNYLPISPILFVPLITLLFVTTAVTIWKIGIRNYTSVGA